MPLIINKETILKFDVPGPRYTSYPTAPVWSEDVNEEIYMERLKAFGKTEKTLSLYIHIPFCRSLCSYCGCNVVIRKADERFGDEYLRYLSMEMDLVSRSIGGRKKVTQFHVGGGTPTFLSEAQIERLYVNAQKKFDIDPRGEIAMEIDPRTTEASKIKNLRGLGFNRISIGVQDFNEEVQRQVGRHQPYPLVKELHERCRELQFESVNFDLIYGLPRQTVRSFRETVEKVILLRPDRIALYSFAYVPWLKRHQKKIEASLLPSSDLKLDIFLNARAQFLEGGYKAIAMDHFALEEDELARAFEAGTLYRNFMGYTVKPADEYIGLGLTSIGFLEDTYVQNQKALASYERRLQCGRLPVERGKILSPDDKRRQWTIRSLMCQFEIDKKAFADRFSADFDRYFKEEQGHIGKCVQDGLIRVEGEKIGATDLGKIFIRNVCMGFDYYLKGKGSHQKFSRTV
jgi:oxygen-independent coproporphyrinogen-3 oxidase